MSDDNVGLTVGIRGEDGPGPDPVGPTGDKGPRVRSFEEGIPCLQAKGRGIAQAWENSLLALWTGGCHIENQYEDETSPAFVEGHQLSVDATMMIVIEDPTSEPAIHRCFPGGLEDLEEYRMEFVDGIKDHWVRDPNAPDYAGEWTYTYHQRFTQYACNVRHIERDEHGEKVLIEQQTINQLEGAVEALAKSPHSRRVKIVTWQPWLDPMTQDPPCLGEFWLRCSQVSWFDGYILNGNAVFRSRDAFDAAFMNLWGEVEFMKSVAGQLQEKLGKPVKVGRLCDLSHSYHIYGKRIQDFKELFLRGVENKPWEDRTWTREFAAPMFEEARAAVLAKVKEKDSRS